VSGSGEGGLARCRWAVAQPSGWQGMAMARSWVGIPEREENRLFLSFFIKNDLQTILQSIFQTIF